MLNDSQVIVIHIIIEQLQIRTKDMQCNDKYYDEGLNPSIIHEYSWFL